MPDFRDIPADKRFEQAFPDVDGTPRRVWVDYAAEGDRRVLLHVEAEDELRGSGAAGRFMQSLADHARAENLRLTPRCGYAVAWFRRHAKEADLLA